MFKFKEFFNDKGEFIPDSEPVAIPVGFQRPPSLQEQIARLVRDPSFVSQIRGEGEEFESFEEADDFDVGDDYDPTSPWEENFDFAAIHAQDRGVVRPFTQEEETRANNTLEKARKGFFSRKRKASAAHLAESEDDAADPQKSEAASSDSD